MLKKCTCCIVFPQKANPSTVDTEAMDVDLSGEEEDSSEEEETQTGK